MLGKLWQQTAGSAILAVDMLSQIVTADTWLSMKIFFHFWWVGINQ